MLRERAAREAQGRGGGETTEGDDNDGNESDHGELAIEEDPTGKVRERR